MRLVRRRLQNVLPVADDAAAYEFRPLMRAAAEKGLIDDPAAWFLYRDKRNITAHTYDETRAMDVVAVIPQFIESVAFVLAALKGANHASGR